MSLRPAFPILVCSLMYVCACAGGSLLPDSGHHQISREDVYARFGEATEIKAYPAGPPPRPPEEGEPDGFPYELWRYSHLDGVGENIELEFVDTCLCGRYVLAANFENARLIRLITGRE